ncbi:hypothetical protein H3Z85_06820 [Chryseobacterium indologenes]|uniref:hypothetical protein n=1 Tax=Chryseobacterium TaxID=59732 RepID=UPI0004B0702F|nr:MULTISPECIES: hypothetical protein [Chryseobacterium]MBF6646823.1 hypothetical protein [Chryseobacterium indologenes]MBU3048262.1 hypothetical protein [Chryseobacterium indologenes]MEB4762999.1 hypothetical protein [Chryseobacterium indologenes]QPQ53087.1 hypothetical protein H3Z85_06820 [Chryseobacterium indologenes]QQQ69523.1 hypothetical protein JHW31_13450 [Chryseobacterium indologenes]
MIQFILMLLGLAFPNNNANTTTDNNPAPVTVHASVELGEDTGGETAPTLPPKK